MIGLNVFNDFKVRKEKMKAKNEFGNSHYEYNRLCLSKKWIEFSEFWKILNFGILENFGILRNFENLKNKSLGLKEFPPAIRKKLDVWWTNDLPNRWQFRQFHHLDWIDPSHLRQFLISFRKAKCRKIRKIF